MGLYDEEYLRLFLWGVAFQTDHSLIQFYNGEIFKKPGHAQFGKSAMSNEIANAH